MIKYKILGDKPENNPVQFSSNIIVTSLNDAAKKLGLYEENGIQVKYDSLCNTHGDKVDCFISSYELSFPNLILYNASNRPILGVSRDNQRFIIEGEYPKDLTGYINLGVDSNKFQFITKNRNKDKFVYCVNTESLVRGGIELSIEAFGKCFEGDKNCKLIIKDRNGTDEFARFISRIAKFYDIEIDYINANWDTETIIEFSKGIDCFIYLNRSSTFALPPLEGLSMGIPTICINYSGPRDYVIDGINALCPSYNLTYVKYDMGYLKGIGCRNFFLEQGYMKEPVWATTSIESIIQCLLEIRENRETREKLNYYGRLTAENMSWEKSALNLSLLLEKWF